MSTYKFLCDWHLVFISWFDHIGGLVQERRNSNALAIELRLSRINPSIFQQNSFVPIIHLV